MLRTHNLRNEIDQKTLYLTFERTVLNTFFFFCLVNLGNATGGVAQRCSVEKGVFKNSAKFTGIPLCQSPFFNKVAGLTLQFYWKRDSGSGCKIFIQENTSGGCFWYKEQGICWPVFIQYCFLQLYFSLPSFALVYKTILLWSIV